MNKFTLLVLCAQALLIQNAFGQAICGQSLNQGLISYGGATQLVSSGCGNNLVQSIPVVSQAQGCGTYGGSSGAYGGSSGGFGGNGVGQLGIVGELPIGGSTLVEGNLPIIGVVEFNGALPAGGYVSVAGNTPSQCSNYASYGSYSSCGCQSL